MNYDPCKNIRAVMIQIVKDYRYLQKMCRFIWWIMKCLSTFDTKKTRTDTISLLTGGPNLLSWESDHIWCPTGAAINLLDVSISRISKAVQYLSFSVMSLSFEFRNLSRIVIISLVPNCSRATYLTLKISEEHLQ